MRWYPARSKPVKGEVPGTRHKWGPVVTFVLQFQDGSDERRISIRLPIWGMYYAIDTDELRWGQLTFQYCGQRGCFLAARFPVERSTVDTDG